MKYLTESEFKALSMYDRIEYEMILGANCKDGFQELTPGEIELYKAANVKAAVRYIKGKKGLNSREVLRLCEASYKGYKDEKERNGILIGNEYYDPFSAGWMNGFYEL